MFFLFQKNWLTHFLSVQIYDKFSFLARKSALFMRFVRFTRTFCPLQMTKWADFHRKIQLIVLFRLFRLFVSYHKD